MLPARAPSFLCPVSGTPSAQGKTRGQTSLLSLPVSVFRYLTTAGFLSFSTPKVPVNRKISFASAVEISRSWQSIPISPPPGVGLLAPAPVAPPASLTPISVTLPR